MTRLWLFLRYERDMLADLGWPCAVSCVLTMILVGTAIVHPLPRSVTWPLCAAVLVLIAVSGWRANRRRAQRDRIWRLTQAKRRARR
jgi:hypothetical protein